MTIKRVFATYFLFVEVNSKKALTFVEERLKTTQTNLLDPQIRTEETILLWLEKSVSEKKKSYCSMNQRVIQFWNKKQMNERITWKKSI